MGGVGGMGFAAGGIELRAAVLADMPLLSVLAVHVYVATYCEGGLRPDQAREALAVYSVSDFERRLAGGHEFTLACRGEQVLGFCETAPPTAPPPSGHAGLADAMEVARLYVIPASQGRGLGRTLLDHAEQRAAARGCIGVWLTAWIGNAHALAFYAAAGYRDLGPTDYVFEDRSYENRVLFKRGAGLAA